MPTTLTLVNYRNVFEQALLTVLRLAFLVRSTVADLSALAALSAPSIAHGEQVYVTDQARVYVYDRFKGGTVSSPNVIAPAVIPTDHPGARWIRAASLVGNGSNWKAPIHGLPTGVLKAVELYNGDGGLTAMFERVYSATPSILVSVEQDRVKPLSAGYQGSEYRVDLGYKITVFSANNRGAPWSSWGSPTALNETRDPGPSAIIGAVRKVVAGLSGLDLDLVGLDRIEIGDSRLMGESEDERTVTWEMDLSAILYVVNADEDLDALTLKVQPELVDVFEAPAFDPLNYVASGLVLPVGSGLTQTLSPGIAMVAGVALNVTPTAHAYTASRDTFVSLDGSGTMTYVERALDAPVGTISGMLLGKARTDASGVIAWYPLGSYAQTFQNEITLSA
mgnify:FL=1